MDRIWHHYKKWEEYKQGMWRNVSKEEEKEFLQRAVLFMSDSFVFGWYMKRVVEKWIISCEQNLSATGMNRQAWIGQAACCLAIGCPEYITRKAWWKLTQQQQDKANAKADEAIKIWEVKYENKIRS
jgi:hypothetical protein